VVATIVGDGTHEFEMKSHGRLERNIAFRDGGVKKDKMGEYASFSAMGTASI